MNILRLVLTLLLLSLCACVTTPKKQNNDLNVSQTDRGVVIQSRDSILFDTGKAEIKTTAEPFLDQVAKILTTKSKSSVLIEGHTDNVGREQLNSALSELRALMVMKALVDRGVDKGRIKAAGYGMSRPIADNGTDAGRQANRRTEIVLLGEKQENLGDDPFENFMRTMKGWFQ